MTTDILPDSLDFGLILVFCGTAASRVSAAAGAYYANPGNKFWRALQQSGMTQRLYKPCEFRALLSLKIGFTDVAKSSAGSDRDLRQSDFQPAVLRQKISSCQPRILAFTSKTAWRAAMQQPPSSRIDYGWQDQCFGETRCFVLPSPSGAAQRYWDIQPWRVLARAYKDCLRDSVLGSNAQ